MEPGKGGSASRRGFINWLLGTSVGAMGASILYPVVRYLIPPDIPEAESLRVVAAMDGELKPNQGKIFRFGSRPAILVRAPDGSYHAFSATCTHLNCTVQYRDDIQHIWCACHNGHFDLDGRNIQGPPPKPLEEYSVNVSGGEIVVSRA